MFFILINLLILVILAHLGESCLNRLLPRHLQNGDFSSSIIFLHLLVDILLYLFIVGLRVSILLIHSC